MFVALRQYGDNLLAVKRSSVWRIYGTDPSSFTMAQQYGGGSVNEVCVHIMVKGVPINGTGHSGMGAYHGKWGFMEFTHPQTVLFGKTHFNLSLREHPYEGGIGSIKRKLVGLFEK